MTHGVAVTADDVIWAYRLLLGREPESKQVVLAQMKVADREQLVRNMMESAEYSLRHTPPVASHSSLNGMEDSPQHVDVNVTPAQLAELVKRVKTVWQRLGTTQPHWSVMSCSEYLPENLQHSIDEFWASGERDVEMVVRILRRVGIHDLTGRSCLEYGCGVGRMTGPLAALFGRVEACDISSTHLDLARERMQVLGRDNVRLRLTDEPLAALPPCDVYYSKIVLQHNPPPIIKILIRRALDALKPGGYAIFQVPAWIAGYRFDIAEYLGAPADPEAGFEVHCLPQKETFSVIDAAGCEIIEAHQDASTGPPALILANLFVVHKPAATPSRISRWFRK